MKKFASLLLLSLLVLSNTACSGELKLKNQITTDSYQQLLKTLPKDATFVFAFNADWCPTCRKQNANLETLVTKFPKSHFYTVNWDKREDFKHGFITPVQRTTITLVRNDVVVAETTKIDAKEIEAFLIANKAQ